MRNHWRRRGAWPAIAALAVTWALTAGPGLCGQAPEPLQNRSPDQAAPTPPGDTRPPGAPATVTVTGSGGNQDATVVVTSPAVGVVGGGVAVPEGGAAGTPDGRGLSVTPGGLKDGRAAPLVPGDPKDGRTTLVPGRFKDGQAVPDAARPGTPPADKGKDASPNVTVTGKGGDQNAKVLVTPQAVVPVAPVAPGSGLAPGAGKDGLATPLVPGAGKDGLAPGKGLPTAVPSGEPIPLGPNARVVDAAGHDVAVPPGQEVTLPQGGKVIDAAGNVVVVPPGGRVVAPARVMTPGDFLPKTDTKPETGKKPAQEPPKTDPAKPGKPQAKLQPDKDGRAKAEKPPDKQAPPAKAAAAKSGERIKIPEEACQKHTLDFLAGCWRGQVHLQDRTDVTIRLCFDTAGVGKRLETYSRNGSKCTGATRASWRGEGLTFSFDKIYCSDGRMGTDAPIVCQGCGDDTRCTGTEYNGSRKIGKTNFEIVKE
ncbi:MAG: hypothetical protein ACP59X_02690 [Solidesulfovibrio sp. DCME]|uniref:hypothetical protein n=1 Tax=Solidesulfovibrio sp. DCME TaxID=3447380 RepID=UPI003D0A7031